MKTAPLMRLELELGTTQKVGALEIYPIVGGRFAGDTLRGRVLPGGADWVTTRPNGVKDLDLRITLETDDGALVYLTFRGILDREHDYFRTQFRFETASPKYERLNRIFGVGESSLTPAGPVHVIEEMR